MLNNWKTYRNEQYGFEVRYPSDWTNRDSKEAILFQERGSTIISIGVVNLTVMGVTYCGAYPNDERCERLGNGITVDWGTSNPSALIAKTDEMGIFFELQSSLDGAGDVFRKFLSTFKFIKLIMRIIREQIFKDELTAVAKEQFGNLVKAVVDVGRGVIAIGGELHADEEALLLQDGSHQKDLWGINLYPGKTREEWIEFDSIINIRPSQGNLSRGVEDSETREKIARIIQQLVV